jgi:cell division protein FtsB
MGKLDDIRNKLQAGSTTKQLVEQGYAKSSVHHVAKKLEKLQPSPATSPVPDEIQELRHQKEIMKLKKEIAEIEAGKEKLPERVAKLEAELHQLNQQLPDLVANCFASLYMVILCKHGWNQDEALEAAKSIGNDFLENFGY